MPIPAPTPSDGIFGRYEADLARHPILGYRAWRVIESALRSETFRYEWTPGLNTAECLADRWHTPSLKPPHTSPDRRCSCGFYAYFEGPNSYASSDFDVQGIIEAGGRALIGSRGMRVQQARIIALVEPRAVPVAFGSGNLDGIWERYGVPVFRTLDLALAEFPLSDCTELETSG